MRRFRTNFGERVLHFYVLYGILLPSGLHSATQPKSTVLLDGKGDAKDSSHEYPRNMINNRCVTLTTTITTTRTTHHDDITTYRCFRHTRAYSVLSELEQRVIEAEERAEEAEDKVLLLTRPPGGRKNVSQSVFPLENGNAAVAFQRESIIILTVCVFSDTFSPNMKNSTR
uniref:Uncharacterized protein n=1 Tax=Glossina austeni TaxID=7395 RepID=A0A1A9VRB3_GLOAU